MSPTLLYLSHGDLLDATLTLTILDWWAPSVLYVNVGLSGSVSTILPYGTSPSLTSAWKPLQMPSIRPSFLSRSSVTPSVIAALRKNAVMNFAEPSGSSPPEKPPGMNTTCDSLRAAANCSTERLISSEVRFLITMISGLAPASLTALALSYSQLVPGNTGMSTFGSLLL